MENSKKKNTTSQLEKVDLQFGLFGYQPPNGKVPISKARVEEAKKLYYEGKVKSSVQILRDINDGLERYLNRISHKK